MGHYLAPDQQRKLLVLHFNDVYNIEPSTREPAGGAARLAHKVREFQPEHPLVLFGGDAFNPSLMSTITNGKQMVPILNAIGVHAAVIGNHDFDYGTENLIQLCSECKFPWLMANVLDKHTGMPYAQAQATLLLEILGTKVGIVGLVEQEWLDTLGAVDPEEVVYEDFVVCGRRLAQELKAQGAELLIALTHMREPNDRRLASEVAEFHLVLGGHDHHYVCDTVQPHNTLLVKSGTDFRDLSAIQVCLGEASAVPTLKCTRHSMTSDIPEDPEVAAVVQQYKEIMGSRMDEVVGYTLTDLNGKFEVVRSSESNLGNFVCDVFRMCSAADIAILNSGSLRSDTIHPAGPLKVRDLMAILPMIDETVVLQVTGAQVLQALENGVSQWPALEGRFPQVSGIKFSFDPTKAAGQRVLPSSVLVGEHQLELAKPYRVATKEYLANGKDGYDVFADCAVLVDAENGVILPTAISYHFSKLRVMSKLDPSLKIARVALKWHRMATREHEMSTADGKAASSHAHLHNTLAVVDPEAGVYAIAPVLEGRIVTMGPAAHN